jgi:dihydroorotate dehydrogenase
MYAFFKVFLFRLSPERAHRLTFWLLDCAAALPPTRWWLRRMYRTEAPQLRRTHMGLSFANPVGLAAGFDKDGAHIAGLACLGFGFIEVGTVTPVAQAGNPQPRLFRLPADQALINRMGFNNAGLEALVERLRRLRQRGTPPDLLIGGNIGKNKNTPNESAHLDYLRCFDALHPWVDYFVVNVSSPNTPNLRELQEKAPLTQLLQTLQTRNETLDTPRPILLKIAPDLTDTQLDDIADIIRDTRLAGVIATNTTISRTDLRTSATTLQAIGMGGLSGQPVRAHATEVIRYLRLRLGPSPVIVGVGGIDSGQSAHEKLAAGANLVQVYTGLVYQGPDLVRRIVRGLAATS